MLQELPGVEGREVFDDPKNGEGTPEDGDCGRSDDALYVLMLEELPGVEGCEVFDDPKNGEGNQDCVGIGGRSK